MARQPRPSSAPYGPDNPPPASASVPVLDARLRSLKSSNDTENWSDDEDLLDADDRATARSQIGESLPTPDTAAEIVRAPRPAATPARRFVNPYEALLDELGRASAFVVMLESQVREFDEHSNGAHRTAAGRSVLARFERERDRKSRIAETCARLGIAERTISLAESKAAEVVRLVSSASSRAGLTSEQRRALMGEIAAEIRSSQSRRIVEANVVAAGPNA